MTAQSNIESRLARIKDWYQHHWPLCVFCNHLVREGDLAHIIRRSYTSKYYTREELQTMKLNTGLSHRECHEIFDNDRKNAVLLPRFPELMYITWLIDPDYYYSEWHDAVCETQIAMLDFDKFPKRELQHHGELLILPTLYPSG